MRTGRGRLLSSRQDPCFDSLVVGLSYMVEEFEMTTGRRKHGNKASPKKMLLERSGRAQPKRKRRPQQNNSVRDKPCFSLVILYTVLVRDSA